MLFLHSFKAPGSTFSVYTKAYLGHLMKQRSPRHLGKLILEANLYLGPFEIILRNFESGMAFELNLIA